MAMQDSLTGLPNRRHFDAALAQEFKRAARDNVALSLIMIDLDHFKGFNDLLAIPPAMPACAGWPRRLLACRSGRQTWSPVTAARK
jgi:predicted signal transduction protein with EAL and GGDEF domain